MYFRRLAGWLAGRIPGITNITRSETGKPKVKPIALGDPVLTHQPASETASSQRQRRSFAAVFAASFPGLSYPRDLARFLVLRKLGHSDLFGWFERDTTMSDAPPNGVVCKLVDPRFKSTNQFINMGLGVFPSKSDDSQPRDTHITKLVDEYGVNMRLGKNKLGASGYGVRQILSRLMGRHLWELGGKTARSVHAN